MSGDALVVVSALIAPMILVLTFVRGVEFFASVTR